MFRLPHIPKADELIDVTFRQGAKIANIERGKGGKQTWENKLINGELERVKMVGGAISGNLSAVVDGMPSFDQMSKFYQQLFLTKIDIEKYRKSIARIMGVSRQVEKLKIDYLNQIKRNKNPDLTKNFLGRASSMVKKITKELEWLIEVKKIMRNFPTVRPDPTIVIAGYPNVGKSTFLKTLTGSKVKTASYPFTTQQVLFGNKKHRYINYQLVDTPGLLDRPFDDRNVVELQAITALKHLAHVILFLFDLSQEIQPQIKLYRQVIKKLGVPTITAVNIKKDKLDNTLPKTIQNKALEFNALDEKECQNIFNHCVDEIRTTLYSSTEEIT